MKKRWLILVMAFLMAGCSSEVIIQRGDGTDMHPNRNMPLPTEEEIWGGIDKENDPSEPVNKRENVFRSGDSLYFWWGGDHWYEIGDTEARSLCRDPLCTHSTDACLNVMAKQTNAVWRVGNDLYFMAETKNSPCRSFVRFSLDTSETKVLAHPTEADMLGGELVGRLGNYIYFSYRRELEKDEMTFEVHQVPEFYRYHIPSGETVFLYEGSRGEEMLQATGKDSELWYRNTSYTLMRADANLSEKTKVSDAKMQTFALVGEDVFYLTRFSTGESGEIRRLDLSTGKDELLYENATWFAYDGGTLYYALYDPVESFVRDRRDPETGKMKEAPIIATNGNKIYTVPADEAGQGGEPVTALDSLVSDGWSLSTTFTVTGGVFIGGARHLIEQNGTRGFAYAEWAVDLTEGTAFEIMRDEVYGQ